MRSQLIRQPAKAGAFEGVKLSEFHGEARGIFFPRDMFKVHISYI